MSDLPRAVTGPRARVSSQLPVGPQTVPRITLARSRLSVSRVGLGLAHLHTLRSNADRHGLLAAALDLGITHFDTARFYGDGFSERALGAWLTGHRKAITIASKFGLLPTPFIGNWGFLSGVARKGRSLLKKTRLVSYPRRSYTSVALELSLVASLKALRTDYIDMYLVHEPLVNSAIGEDLIDALERRKAAGTIRAIGVAGSTIDRVITQYIDRWDVIQSGEGAWQPARFVPDITYSVFSAGLPVEGRQLSSESAETLLTRALARRQNGAVIVQTRHVRHLQQLAHWAAKA